MNDIDAHVHVWTPDVARYPLAEGYTVEQMRPRSFTPEELFRHTRPAGVTRINLIQMSFYGFDNRYMLDMMRAHPDTFSGTAVIDPHVARPDDEMRALADRGVRAFRITTRLSRMAPDRWLQPPGFERMFAEGGRRNLAMSCLIEPDCLPELDRMCRRYPDTPVIVDHVCRIGLDGTIREADIDAFCRLAERPRTMAKLGAFYALGRKTPPYADLAPMIQRVVRAFGARRCMWESDCPFQVNEPHTYRASIDLVRTGLPFLSPEDRDWILRRTAEAFFFARR